MNTLENDTTEKLPNQHFDYLDGWRGLAIALLLIGHFFPVPGINLGRVGVDFFFVLSGLLMCRLLFIKEVPIKTFYKRRIARIFPAHFTYLILIVSYFLLAGKQINWSETLMAGLFINNYFPGEIGHAVMPFGHIWSLSVEEHSYIALSIIAIAARRHILNSRYTIGVLILLSIILGIRYWLIFPGEKLTFELLIRSEISSYGILLSALLVLFFQEVKAPTLPTICYPAIITLGLGCYWWSMPIPVRGFIGVGFFAIVVNLLPTAPAIIKNALSIAPLRALGLYSFSIYLWQQVFYLSKLPAWMALSASIGCGVASYYLVENPVRHYLNTRWKD